MVEGPAPTSGDGTPAGDAAGKTEWRARILASRRTLDDETRSREAHALAEAVERLGPVGTLATYAPLPDEPGSGSPASPDSFVAAATRAARRVLLPVTPPAGPLSWSVYEGPRSVREGRFGIVEPIGPVLPPSELARADVVLVPALAVDLRGVRLGRGAGYYDRTLGHARPDAMLVAVVRDDDVVNELPEDPYDIRVGWILTPGRGPVRVPE
ncbi:5-formyltetrahydrofolate cyclo-ligase [Rhodococcus rhodnii]|uniref:5-formyltetrahydrofolate cyclo-ligase n=2 Tax=Rhodococcus rhodnii TaxID=38312 RepID=R7WTZ3_9NOCA|nr:5-formyltetrahydrofolate cyclo-ligase [Rhodococcus rhodnii]EOM77624.1 hypothetical protein Rrhod_1035 [Rhodococcus rhodnii LMG 5362]TXG90209.1 5-formyltetrahydrofolate cyclo-ligase [Rhodococcus rhodnii]